MVPKRGLPIFRHFTWQKRQNITDSHRLHPETNERSYEDFRFLSENVYVCPHEPTVSDYAEVNANGI